ncbi:MAG: Mur ligase family protein [Dehalococcoidia bacterium]
MDARLAAAVAAGKATAFAARALRRGGGTALPGLVAERIEPRVAAKLASGLGLGSVLITGTNGKTTTARVLASIAREAGFQTLHNREGSNLMRGIGSALIARAGPLGNLTGARQLGIFEVDEATMPLATHALRPRAMAFTNLFRDQLDRYGEVDTVFALWQSALAAAPPDGSLVLNADDPSIADLATRWSGPVHWFGIDDPAFGSEAGGASDARWCRACGGSYAYDLRYFAHLGHWRCAGCGRERPALQTRATNIHLALESATFEVEGLGAVQLPLTGLYNVYNALAAITLARVLEIGPEAILRGLSSVRPAFGRQEVVELSGRRLRVLLAKNPAGANQVIRLLQSLEGPPLNLAVLLNDRIADGRDVSWTWDVDYELLAARVAAVWVGGDRSEDMALRLAYARWPEPGLVARGPAAVLDAILAGSRPGDDVFVLPTYTAMLDLRKELVRRGAAARFWQS